MNLTRSGLKDIVKECLIEILMEGISQHEKKTPSVQESTRRVAPAPPPAGKKHLDSILFSAGASKVAAQAQGQTQRYAAAAAEVAPSVLELLPGAQGVP